MDDVAVPRDRMLQVGDLHFWEVVTNPLKLLNKRFLGNLNVILRRGREFAMERAEPSITALAECDVDHVLFTGDFTSTSTEEEFARARAFVDAVRARGMETWVLPGNHDVYTFESARAKRFEKHFRGLTPPSGYPALMSLPGGTPVILAPTVRPNVLASSGCITPEQTEAVAALLKQVTGPVLVAAHYPLLNQTDGYRLTRSRRLAGAEELRKTLAASGKQVLHVAGHTHRFSWTRDPEHSNVMHLTTGAFFRKDHRTGLQGEFSEIHVYEDGFRVMRHVCAAQWRTIEVQPTA